MNWEEENNIIINTYFKKIIKEINHKKGCSLELFITDVCNQNCEYCYLIKHQDELYPKNFRSTKQILNNLQIFLNYLIENNYDNILKFSLFSGEIWHTQFGLDVLETIYQYCLKAKQPPLSIMIPSNFSFILDDIQLQKIETYIDKFNKKNIYLNFSCSIDGFFIESENRPFNNSNNNYIKDSEEHYEKIFKWCKKYGYGFHPMVNSFNIEKWKQQYKWWIDNFIKYELNFHQYSMFLEVRDNNWTDNKIYSYLDYLNFSVDYLFESYFKDDPVGLLKTMLNIDTVDNGNYINIQITRQSARMSCTVDRIICIRLGDLSWVPCHRTSYDPFVYGTFQVQDNKIQNLIAKNVILPASIYSLGYKGHPKCDICPIADLCLRGCYGAQFEANKDLFYPCETVCNLFFAKNLFLYYKIKEIIQKYNISDNNITYQIQEIYKKYISKISDEETKQWIPMIKRLIVN